MEKCGEMHLASECPYRISNRDQPAAMKPKPLQTIQQDPVRATFRRGYTKAVMNRSVACDQGAVAGYVRLLTLSSPLLSIPFATQPCTPCYVSNVDSAGGTAFTVVGIIVRRELMPLVSSTSSPFLHLALGKLPVASRRSCCRQLPQKIPALDSRFR